jgi:hypothetical protein
MAPVFIARSVIDTSLRPVIGSYSPMAPMREQPFLHHVLWSGCHMEWGPGFATSERALAVLSHLS